MLTLRMRSCYYRSSNNTKVSTSSRDLVFAFDASGGSVRHRVKSSCCRRAVQYNTFFSGHMACYNLLRRRVIVLSLLLTVVAPIQSFSQTTSRLWTPSVNPPFDVSRRRRYTLCASSTEDSTSTDEEMDVLFEELFQESISASLSYPKNNNTVQVPSHFIQGKETIGIGGNAGFVYDVNALKRNLVQESVKRCKQELLLLLGDGRQNNAAGVSIPSKVGDDQQRTAMSSSSRWRRDRDDLIEDRLAALVQANPVSTTTDSNLLDGSWSFAFATNSASTILDTSRFLLSKTKRVAAATQNNSFVKGESVGSGRGGPWRFRSGRTENPFRSSTRQIFLENLDDSENAHIIDETRLMGGLFQSRIRYDVYGLTRTSIDLDMTESESICFGMCVNSSTRVDFKGTKQGKPLEIQVIYLDSDLCICTTGEGLDGPLHVYTKSDTWNTGGAKRTVRLITNTISWITSFQSPLRIRQRLLALQSRTNVISKKIGPGLKAINIGELDLDKDGATRADQFWDGKDDPFVHLSPGERMEVLKSMSLKEIYRSASERKEQNKKQKWRWWGGQRNYTFKRPEK